MPNDTIERSIKKAAGNEEGVDYALEGSVFVGGAVIQWLRDELKVIPHIEEFDLISNILGD